VRIPVASAGLVRNSMSSGNPGLGTAVGIGSPRCREVELAGDHRVPGGAGVGEVDRDLGVSIRPAVPVY
jgi:hypothetical protein